MTALVRRFRQRREGALIRRSGLFDGAWYIRRYPDIAAAGLDPLRHYVESGAAEGRFPNPIFDSRWYAAQYPTRRAANPLVDYIRDGVAHGRRPNRWFDPDFYRRRYRLGSDDPVRHYLAAGGGAGHETIADFPIADFVQLYSDVGCHGSPLGSFLHDYRVVGALDLCTSYYVRGWTSRVQGPPAVLSVRVDGVAVGDVAPWIARPDVANVTGLVALGFVFAFPQRLSHGDIVTIADEFGDVPRHCTTTYEIPSLGSSPHHYPSRAAVAARFLQGRGLEVGAFTQPTDLPPDREVLFFDRYPADALRRFYDRDCGRPMMEPTYVGDAECLEGVPRAAFDFIIANHVIEHLLDPIRFLDSVAACLVEGGRAMIAAPDKRFTFDIERALTPFAHLVEDHARGGVTSQFDHFVEYARLEGHDEETAQASARAFDPETIHFHYHVWDADSFVGFVETAITTYNLPLAMLYHESTVYDVIVVLEKRQPLDR